MRGKPLILVAADPRSGIAVLTGSIGGRARDNTPARISAEASGIPDTIDTGLLLRPLFLRPTRKLTQGSGFAGLIAGVAVSATSGERAKTSEDKSKD